MKITIGNIIDFMKTKQNLIITDKQVKEIKKHFYKDVEKLVYCRLYHETPNLVLIFS